MTVKNCRRCKRLFNYISGQQMCPNCRQEIEGIFQKVKDYIRDNKSVTVQEVCEKFSVDEAQMREWIREERLVFSDPSTAGIFCEVCGTPIVTGRYCEKCKAETINSLNSLIPKQETKPVKKERDKARMRFLDK